MRINRVPPAPRRVGVCGRKAPCPPARPDPPRSSAMNPEHWGLAFSAAPCLLSAVLSQIDRQVNRQPRRRHRPAFHHGSLPPVHPNRGRLVQCLIFSLSCRCKLHASTGLAPASAHNHFATYPPPAPTCTADLPAPKPAHAPLPGIWPQEAWTKRNARFRLNGIPDPALPTPPTPRPGFFQIADIRAKLATTIVACDTRLDGFAVGSLADLEVEFAAATKAGKKKEEGKKHPTPPPLPPPT